jgi:hypothetical protein
MHQILAILDNISILALAVLIPLLAVIVPAAFYFTHQDKKHRIGQREVAAQR